MHLDDLRTSARKLRGTVLEMIHRAGHGYSGLCLSMIDILATLYLGTINGKDVLNVDVQNPHKQDRDYVILSHAHAAPALYAVLAMKGFFDQQELMYFHSSCSKLTATPSVKIPGIDATGGQPGLGLSLAVGMALAAKRAKKENRFFVLVGDEELQSGLAYEALLSAGHYNLDNLLIVLNRSKVQKGFQQYSVLDTDPLVEKIKSVKCDIIHVVDGHNYDLLLNAYAKGFVPNRKPTVMMCHTISGKGIPFAENKATYFAAPFSSAEMKEARAFIIPNERIYA